MRACVQVGPRQWERVLQMVKRIRGLGMEVCTTLGMLTPEQVRIGVDDHDHACGCQHACNYVFMILNLGSVLTLKQVQVRCWMYVHVPHKCVYMCVCV